MSCNCMVAMTLLSPGCNPRYGLVRYGPETETRVPDPWRTHLRISHGIPRSPTRITRIPRRRCTQPRAVAQQDLVQLRDVVLGERDVLLGRKYQVHQLGIAGHFLLVADDEGLDPQVRQELLHLPVGQLAALNAGEEPMLSMVATRRRADRR